MHREKIRWQIMGQAYGASTRSKIFKGDVDQCSKETALQQDTTRFGNFMDEDYRL